MKSKAIFGLLALFVAILGFSSATYAAIDLSQGAEVQVGEGWGNVVEAKDLPKHTATNAGATSNIAKGDGWSLDVVIDASQNWTVVATGNVPEGSFPLFVQKKGKGNDTNVYKSTITISKDVEGNPVINLGSGLGTDSVNEVRWGSFVLTPPVLVPENCDTSKVSGGVAKWLQDNGFDGADCFDHAVEQRCGYLNVSITKQPLPLYAQGPFVAAYTINGRVAEPYKSFPATFAEDFNNGSVDVTWFTVGPEKDWLIDTTFPNFWSNVGRTITVDTDCKLPEGGMGGGGTTPTPETPVTPSTPETPKTPVTPASSISALPYTSGSITPAVAVGVLSILGLVVAVAGSIKSRMLVS